jgi:AcrR family transcriptional regulator
MADIEQATGLKRQSLYRAFGDKRQMYLAALRDYDRNEITAAIKLLRQQGSPSEKIDVLLKTIINHALSSGDRRGCLLCNASVDQAPLNEPSGQVVRELMRRFEKAIDTCLLESPALAADDTRRKETTGAVLAGYFGIRVMIKAGLSRAALERARRGLVVGLL